jgi:uncharacterized membrane protein
MVTTELNPDTGEGHIVLKPNNSATWRFNMAVWSSLAFIAACISTIFLFMGLWMIFPFSGLEVMALYAGLHYVAYRNCKTEVITFRGDKVIVEQGRNSSERIWEYQRSWAKIFVRKPTIRGYPVRIFIRSHGKELELGAFLNKQDKERLISNLKKLVYA